MTVEQEKQLVEFFRKVRSRDWWIIPSSTTSSADFVMRLVRRMKREDYCGIHFVPVEVHNLPPFLLVLIDKSKLPRKTIVEECDNPPVGSADGDIFTTTDTPYMIAAWVGMIVAMSELPVPPPRESNPCLN